MKCAKMLLIIMLLAVLTLPAFGAPDGIEDIQQGFADMSKILGRTFTSNAVLGLTWSDAYIGQLIGAPPHFGIGISAGGTLVGVEEFDSLFNALDMSLSEELGGLSVLPVPAGGLEARIGGFILPFDIGIKALPLPNISGFQYTMFGADVRYAILRDRGLFPDLSVGLGFTYTKFGFEMDGGSFAIPLDSLGTPFTTGDEFTVDNTKLGFDVENTTLDLKVQVSKHIVFITPYLGLGASYGWSTVGYHIKGSASITGGTYNDLMNAVNGLGIPGIHADGSGISSSTEYNNFLFRAFGGLSFDIAVIRIDFTGVYNFGGNFGANLGFRFQL